LIPRYARQAFARPGDIRVIEAARPVIDTLWLIHRSEWPITSRATRAIAHLRQGMASAQTAIAGSAAPPQQKRGKAPAKLARLRKTPHSDPN
jgi:hypothetical protein